MNRKTFQIKSLSEIVGVMVLLTGMFFSGCGKLTKEDINALKTKYNQAGGYVLGAELAKKFPNAKTLVVLPNEAIADKAGREFYEGFKVGAGSGLSVTEVVAEHGSNDLAHMEMMYAERPFGTMGPPTPDAPKPTKAEFLAKMPVRGCVEVADALIQSKGKDCTLVVFFAGIPLCPMPMPGTSGGRIDPTVLAKSTMFMPVADKTKKVAVACPGGIGGIKEAVDSGAIVMAVVQNPEGISKWPKTDKQTKIFEERWLLLTK